MLLKLYKTNHPAVLLLLPFVILVFWVVTGYSDIVNIEHTFPLFQAIYSSNALINKLSGATVILLSGLLLNSTITRNEFFNRNTFLPAFLYVLLMGIFPTELSPAIIGNFFVILAFRRLTDIYSQASCKSELFDASFWLLIGGLFYPPVFFLLPLVWIIWFIFRPFNFSEFIIPFFAIILISLYYYASFIFTDSMKNHETFDLISPLYKTYRNNIISLFIYFEIVILTLLGSSIIYKKRKSNTNRFKKLTTALLWLGIFCLSVALLAYSINGNTESFSLVIVPGSIFLSYFFMDTQKHITKEFAFYLLIITILSVQFY